MEDKKTPLIDFAPKAVGAIVRCQEILAEYIVPDSGISDHECINRILGVLDDGQFVKELREAIKPEAETPTWPDKVFYPTSPNVEWTRYVDGYMELCFRNGKVYQYFDIPAALYERLILAPSIGSFLANHIKGRYRYCAM